MAFLTDRYILGFATETTAGTAETLVAADFLNTAYEISPIDRNIEKKNRKLANGHHGYAVASIGKKMGSITFSMDITYAGSVSTEPEFGKVLESCGWEKTAYTTTGIGYLKNAVNDCKTATIEFRSIDCINTNQKVEKLVGAIGKEQIILDAVGNPVKITFTFEGKLLDQTETATLINPLNNITSVPDVVIGSAITYGANELSLDKFTYDGGNATSFFVDAGDNTGINHFAITASQPSFKADPEMSLSATDTVVADELAGTTRAVVVPIGSNITLTIPEVQVIECKRADRNGYATHDITFGIVNIDGDSGAEILIGAKA